MSDYNKISLSAIQNVYTLLLKKYMSYSEFKNKKLLDELILNNAISISDGRTKVITLKSDVLIFRYLKKSNGSLAQSIEKLKEYIDFELKEEVKSKDEIAKYKEKTKDDTSKSFHGIHIAVTKDTMVYQNEKEIYLSPVHSGSYFFFQKDMITVPSDTVVIGVENPQVLWLISRYTQYFNYEKLIFVLVNDYKNGYIYEKWLSTIEGKYIHFGDYDLSGISIYYDKVLPKLKDKENADFFIFENIFQLIEDKGNREDFENQKSYLSRLKKISTGPIYDLVKFIEKQKKSIEQEKLSSFVLI